METGHKDFDKFDFSEIKQYMEKAKEDKKNRPDDEKKKEKEKKD